jgi:hypothetical protein
MQCAKIKDIIITDYIDNELDAKTRADIDSHLEACSECRAFKEDVFNTAVKPFRRPTLEPVPAFIWGSIRNKIAESSLKERQLPSDIFSLLKPQWLNVSVIGLTLFFTLFLGNFFALDIWSSVSQRHIQDGIEVSNNLEFNVFSDIPGEQAQNASAIIGG